MNWNAVQDWLNTVPLWAIGLGLLLGMALAAGVGVALSGDRAGREGDESNVGYVVSAVLGLLALLMGFTFSLAVDRYDARRVLVAEDAKIIGTTYLRAQLLPEPHRARMTDLLIRYVDNRVALGKAQVTDPKAQALLATNDAMLTDIWTATSASFDSIKQLDFSSAYIDSVNQLLDMDTARKAARRARVPVAVFFVLFVYMTTTAGVLGYVLVGHRGRIQAVFLLALLTLSLLLIIDIDRPASGAIVERQGAMDDLQATLRRWRPEVFDRWKDPSAGSPASGPPARPARPTP